MQSQPAANLYWRPDSHYQMPQHIQIVVWTMMMVRIVEHEPRSMMVLLPNELMFEIFSHLPYRMPEDQRSAPPTDTQTTRVASSSR
jgi:hypothetical protein